MFDFIVRNFGFLKHVPLLPHIFDSLLRLRTFVYKRHLLDVFDSIEDEVLSWKDTTVSIHKYGGLQFNVHKKEIGHLHSNGLLDVVYSRKIKTMLMKEGRVSDHHLFKKSGWISFYIASLEDKDYAIKLLMLSYSIKITSFLPPD
jgi:hypothetical protein